MERSRRDLPACLQFKVLTGTARAYELEHNLEMTRVTTRGADNMYWQDGKKYGTKLKACSSCVDAYSKRLLPAEIYTLAISLCSPPFLPAHETVTSSRPSAGSQLIVVLPGCAGVIVPWAPVTSVDAFDELRATYLHISYT